MEGAALAAERDHETRLLEAYHGAAWTGAAYAGKLKAFSSYIKREDRRQQTGEEMLSAMFALQDAGAPMTVEQIN